MKASLARSLSRLKPGAHEARPYDSEVGARLVRARQSLFPPAPPAQFASTSVTHMIPGRAAAPLPALCTTRSVFTT